MSSLLGDNNSGRDSELDDSIVVRENGAKHDTWPSEYVVNSEEGSKLKEKSKPDKNCHFTETNSE